MKKTIIFLLILLSTFLIVSCKNKEVAEKTPDPATIEQTQPGLPEITGVQYVRTDGCNEIFEYPRLVRITYAAELDRYHSYFNGIWDLSSHESLYSDTTIGFLDAAEKYDGEYFGTHDLYLAVLEEGSGSIRHSVDGIENGSVTITSIVPEEGTDDMAEWHIFLEVNKADILTGINGKETKVYTPDELYLEFCSVLKKTALEYLEREHLITDAEIENIAKTDFGTASEQISSNPLGYNPGNQSPVWQLDCSSSDGKLFTLYLSSTPFVFGAANLE